MEKIKFFGQVLGAAVVFSVVVTAAFAIPLGGLSLVMGAIDAEKYSTRIDQNRPDGTIYTVVLDGKHNADRSGVIEFKNPANGETVVLQGNLTITVVEK